jgi:hypothetical protein
MKLTRWVMNFETAKFSFDDATCSTWIVFESCHYITSLLGVFAHGFGVRYNHVCWRALLGVDGRDQADRSIGRLGI